MFRRLIIEFICVYENNARFRCVRHNVFKLRHFCKFHIFFKIIVRAYDFFNACHYSVLLIGFAVLLASYAYRVKIVLILKFLQILTIARIWRSRRHNGDIAVEFAFFVGDVKSVIHKGS